MMPNLKTIGVFSPSSYVEKDDIEAAKALMEKRDYQVFVHPQTFERFNQSAGTHQQKIDALHDLYRDKDIDVIWAAGGGNRSLHILDDLDFDLIRSNPKPMIGFSDVTALINGITVRTGITNIHGPVFKNLSKHWELDELLNGNFNMPLDSSITLNEGIAEGFLYGGNLSLFQYLPQTLGLDFLKGAILFLEDCNEELSRIDRMLLHLKKLGVFDAINGLILGDFTDLKDSARPFGFTLKDIVQEHTEGLRIPVTLGAPFGHGEYLYSLPVGAKAVFKTGISLNFL